MAYVMLVAAVMTSAVVMGLCYLLKWRRVYIVAPLQFVASLVVTYSLGPRIARDEYTDDSMLVALIISAAMPLLFGVLRVVIGRMDRRRVGGIVGDPPNSERSRV